VCGYGVYSTAPWVGEAATYLVVDVGEDERVEGIHIGFNRVAENIMFILWSRERFSVRGVGKGS
jgi:hypothetical protein